jgi:hypothetical protein
MGTVRYFKICLKPRTDEETDVLIQNLKDIIDELLTTALKAVTTGNIAEYEINTGQTTNKVKYTNQKDIIASIEGYEKLLQIYSNRRIPRSIKLVNATNFRR